MEQLTVPSTIMVDVAELQPIILTPWPSCQDCLSWSEDDIAVACGEVVHILTPKSALTVKSLSGHPRWDLSTVKVNFFNENEWPYQTLATIKHFSIGEEQSNSLVTALAFSYAGLGMHQRSVLAILTSNLVLSLWETDGSSGEYKRTCIVNHYLDSHKQEVGHGPERRKLRIRAFLWSPLLLNAGLPRSDAHHLVVTDDDSTISILHVSKISASRFGHWKLETKLRVSWTEIVGPSRSDRILSPLQARLEEQASVSEISQSEWREELISPEVSNVSGSTYATTIAVSKGSTTSTFNVIAVRTSKSYDSNMADNGSSIDGFELTVVDKGDLSGLEHRVYHNNLTGNSGNASLTTNSFRQALQSVCRDFDQQHQLDGHYRIRFWGTAVANHGAMAAACVTLHPSDMIEHTIRSSEKTVIVFERLRQSFPQVAALQRDRLGVQQLVLSFLSSSLDDGTLLRYPLDQKILKIYKIFAQVRHDPFNSGKAEAIAAKSSSEIGGNEVAVVPQTQHSAFVSDTDATVFFPEHAAPEKCEICSADIPFGRDTISATCRTGHQFTRCNLSLVAIQEPGISKYCAGCGKQFLDLAKLGTSEGPSLSQALFDEFNICPYCQAKFRG